MEWLPIETAPLDRAILLRGGSMNQFDDDDDFPENLPASNWTAVVAIWNETYWDVGHYDSGYGSIGYFHPSQWMEIPQ